MKVAVFGVGYVGSVTAACLAASGHDVWGVDVDESKVEALNAGRAPVVEPRLSEMVARNVARGRLHATTDAATALSGAAMSLVCVGTPSTPRGWSDLSYLRGVVASIAASYPADGGRHVVVVRSTVPPGTVNEVVAPILDDADGDFGTAMCPEFLREGTSVDDFFTPPFVVVGSDEEWVRARVGELFAFLGREISYVDTKSAEALKYACNAFHATKVSFANEMGRVLRLAGVDSRQVMELFCQDSQLNISRTYLRPGFAFGGSCLPKDLRALLHLARTGSVDMPLLSGALASNELVVQEAVDRVVAMGDRSVALLGLSFKTSTDDLRESASVELAERLVGKGYDLRIYDPLVNPVALTGANKRHVESKLPHLRRLFFDAPHDALDGADIAVVSSTDPAVLDALVARPPRHVIDLDGRLGEAVELLPGYEGIGW